MQLGLGLLAFDRGAHLGGDELQQLAVGAGVAGLATVFDHQRADRAVLRLQRHAEPVRRFRARCRGWRRPHDLAAVDHLADACVGSEVFRPGSDTVFVGHVRESQVALRPVAQGDEEIGHGQDAADDPVQLPEQRRQVLRGMRRLGDRVQRQPHRFAVLERGDVAGDGDPHLVGLGPARRPHDVHHLAVLAHVAVLEVGFGLAVHDRRRGAQRDVAVVRMHELDHPSADHLLGGIAEDALERGADEHVAALGVDDADGVQQQVQDLAQRGECGCFHRIPMRRRVQPNRQARLVPLHGRPCQPLRALSAPCAWMGWRSRLSGIHARRAIAVRDALRHPCFVAGVWQAGVPAPLPVRHPASPGNRRARCDS